MNRRLLIWGAGDQGIVTLDCALAVGAYSRIDFLDIREKGRRQIPGYRIYREEESDLDAMLESYDEAIVASGSNGLREAKSSTLTLKGMPLATLIHPTAAISPSANVSQGCTVLANASINPNAHIGIGCIINTNSVIEHDCVVGDFSNICPSVSMAGHTRLGRKSFLGIGCTVIDGVTIGEEAVIGAGAVVIRDVPAGAVAVGVPAKAIR